jgi:hypothetical protein
MSKPFDQELFDKNDQPAREVVKHFFAYTWGLILNDNPDKYGPDLVAHRGSVFEGFVEVEVRHSWKGNRFPFEKVQFAMRKAKFFSYKPITFVILNSEMTHLLWFNGIDLELGGKRITKNTRLTVGETFIEVPIEWGHKVTSHLYCS